LTCKKSFFVRLTLDEHLCQTSNSQNHLFSPTGYQRKIILYQQMQNFFTITSFNPTAHARAYARGGLGLKPPLELDVLQKLYCLRKED